MKWWIPQEELRIRSPIGSADVSVANLVRAARAHGIDVDISSHPPDKEERTWVGKGNPVSGVMEWCKKIGVDKARFRVWMAGPITEQSLVSYDVSELKQFLNMMDLIVCPSAHEKSILLHKDVRSPVILLPQPVGEQFQYYERPSLPHNPMMFLTIAPLSSWRKGAHLLGAVFELWKGGVLVILSPYAGDTPFDRCDHVRVVRTAIPNTELHEFMKDFDVYIHLGLTETFSYTAYEALATGIPCIVTRTPALLQWLPEQYWPYMVEMSDRYLFDARDPGHCSVRLPSLERLWSILDHVKQCYGNAVERARAGSEIVRQYMSPLRWLEVVESTLEQISRGGEPLWDLKRAFVRP